MTATLQMLLDEGIGLRCWCRRCRHGKGRSWTLDAAPMAKTLGADYPIPYLTFDVMCEKCGSTRVEVQPDWPSPGVIVRPVP